MKNIVIMILVCVLGLAGCSSPKPAFHVEKADGIVVMYGFSSYAMFGASQDVLDSLTNQLNSLSFAQTDEQMDFPTQFLVTLSDGKKDIAKFSVDENGVFQLDGQTQNHKVSSGSFDYTYLKEAYENSKNP